MLSLKHTVKGLCLCCLTAAGFLLGSCQSPDAQGAASSGPQSAGGAAQSEQAVPSETPGAAAQAVYHKISAAQAKEKMDSGEEYILLDVRTQEEYAEAHIEGAILLPDFDILSKAAEQLPDKAAVVLVYCRSGRRSENAANALVGLGYTNIYDFGGIIDWPYETVSGAAS